MTDSHSTISRSICEALLAILARLEGADVCWALTGSLAHALQGVPVEVHDIDLQTDEASAYTIESCMSDLVVQRVAPSSTERIRSHFGVFEIKGVRVEVMGAVQKRHADGEWEVAVDVSRHRTFVSLEDRAVPVLNLTYESAAYELLGRTERSQLLRRYAGGASTGEIEES